MNGMAFDTLKIAKELGEAGFAPKQAEALSRAMAAAMTGAVATREDITRLDGRFTLHQWMIGVTITLNVAILARLLFG